MVRKGIIEKDGFIQEYIKKNFSDLAVVVWQSFGDDEVHNPQNSGTIGDFYNILLSLGVKPEQIKVWRLSKQDKKENSVSPAGICIHPEHGLMKIIDLKSLRAFSNH